MRPEAIRGVIDAMLHILSKEPGEKPGEKGKDLKKESTLEANHPNAKLRGTVTFSAGPACRDRLKVK